MTLDRFFALTGRSAIVTGGGGGLGLAFAEALAEGGADVVLCGRNGERCEEASTAIAETYGVRAVGMHCDVRDEGDIAAVVDRARSELGRIDILVNNAGTSWGAPAAEYPIEGWQKVLDVNLTGLFRFSQNVARVMIEHGGGKIVNIASVAAFTGAPPEVMDAVAYTASKGAVVSLTRDLAVKWARFGITVNAIAPGWFPTDMSRVLLERHRDEFLRRIPVGRFGDRDDLKGAIVFLAGKGSDFVSGHTLVVDGGQSAT